MTPPDSVPVPEAAGERPYRTAGYRLSAARSTYRQRGTATVSSDRYYTLYLIVLVALVAVAPTVRAVVIALAEPTVIAVIEPGESLAVVSAVVLALVTLGGALHGPAVPRAFEWSVLGATDLPRALVLRRPMIAAAALLSALLALGGGGRLVSIAIAGHPVIAPVTGILALVLLALIATVLWLCGQVLGDRAWLPAAILVALSLLPPGLPLAPGRWVALSAAGQWWPLIPLAAFAVLGIAAVPRLLTSLSGPAVSAQALRRESATMALGGGDTALALASFRSAPSIARALPAVRVAPTAVNTRRGDHRVLAAGAIALGYLRRGAVGALRTPVRAVLGGLGLVGAGALAGIAATTGGTLGALYGGSAALLCFLSLGPLSDGVRHAVEAAIAPALYGYRRAALIGLHALFPVVTGVLLGTIGVLLVAPTAIIAAILIALIAAAVRLLDAAKGPVPPSVLAPLPTPMGDVSALNILLWQADAVVMVALAGAGICALLSVHLGAAVAVALALIGLLLLNTRRRIAAA